MQNLDIKLTRSKQFMWLNIFFLGGSIAIIFYLHFIFWIKLGLIGLACFYSIRIISGNNRFHMLSHRESGWWIQTLKNRYNIELSGDSTITHFVSILRFDLPGKRWKQSCVIFKDVMTEEEYRQFVVRARNMR